MWEHFIGFLRVTLDLLSLPLISDDDRIAKRIDRSFKIKSN